LSNIVNLYTNPSIYWPVIAISCALLLFTVVCALHHWNKTDFKDYLLLHKQEASGKELNKTFKFILSRSIVGTSGIDSKKNSIINIFGVSSAQE
jgi:hypothetical protein